MNHFSICNLLKNEGFNFQHNYEKNSKSNSTCCLMFVVRKGCGWSDLRVFLNHEIKAWGPLFNFKVQESKSGENLVEVSNVTEALFCYRRPYFSTGGGLRDF